MAPVSQGPEVTLAQRLASNDHSIRIKALKTLRKYINLRSQKIDGGFTTEDLLKIWKGLFYCLWMQDKPTLQEEISHRISGLIHSFHTFDVQLLYYATFLQTIKREWNGIDRLRMDKFFQLVRFMFRQAFEVLRRRQWETSLVNQFLQVFTEQILQNPDNVPKGLMLHILDLYMTELAQIGSAELTAEQNMIFIDPFCKTMAKTKDRLLLDFISRNIFRTILDHVPFAIEDLMRELQRGGGDDSDSGQASGNEEEEMVEKEKLKSQSAKKTKVKVNGISEKVENDKKSTDDLDLDSIGSDETDDVGPVLQFDYGAVADRLFELGSRLSTQNVNRTKLYILVKSFRGLCEGLLSQKEDDNGDLSSTSDKTSSKEKKKRKNEKPTAGDESVAKKSKVCQVQVGLLNNTMKDVEKETVVLKSYSKHHRQLDRQLKTSEIEADDESASRHNEPDSQSQLKVITAKKKWKSKKLKTNSQEVGGNLARKVPLVLQKSDEHQTDNCKVKRKQKKSKAESGIGNQASKDFKALAQTSELASFVESPVEAGQAECGISLMRKKTKKKSKKKFINKGEEQTVTEKPPKQISLYSRLETDPEVTQAKSQDGGTDELEAITTETKMRRKRKKMCSSLQDVGKELAVQSLPKENNAGEKIRTLDNDTNATQSQLETSTTQKKKVKRKKCKSSLQDVEVEFKSLGVLNTDGHNHDDEFSTHTCPTSKKGSVTQCRLKASTTKGKKVKNVEEQVNSKTQESTAEKKKKEIGSKYQENLEGKEAAVSSDSEIIPANKNIDDTAKFSQPKSAKKAKKTKRLPLNEEESMLEAKEQLAIRNTSTQQADTPVRKKRILKKQLSRPTEEAKELVPKKIVKEKPDPAPSANICTPVINSLTPMKKGKTKRKLQTDKADISQNNEHAEEKLGGKKSKISDTKVSTSVTPKKLKMKKGSPKSDLVSFQGLIKPPTPLFCKTKPKSSTPLTSIKEKFQTPKSETKKVTFGLKNNKTTEFRKTDRSLLVSPVGSSRVVFDPKKMPASGVLKSPSLSPVVSVKKHAVKKRATAADFF